jgi:Family of unknown function (DUF5990)
MIDVSVVARHVRRGGRSRADQVFVGVQCRREVVGRVPADTDEVSFELTVDVIDGPNGLDFRGPFVHGRPGDRFLYLNWGTVGADGEFEMFSRAKLRLQGPYGPPHDVGVAMAGGSAVRADVDLVRPDGRPISGQLGPPQLIWSVA